MLVKRNRFSTKMFYAFNEGGGDGTGGAASSDVSAVPAFEAPVANNEFASRVPSEYQQSSYVQQLLQAENPEQELWKTLESLHQTVNSRPGGMPSDEAPDTEWEKWITSVQPKNVSVYGDIKPALGEGQEHLKDMIEASYTPEFTSEILEGFRQAGITAKQSKIVTEKFNQLQLKAADAFAQQAQQEQTRLNTEFDQMMADTFGQDKTKVLEVGAKFIKENLPPKLQDALKLRPNDELVALAAAVYQVQKTYGKEDTIPTNGQGSGFVANDVITLNAEINKAMTDNDGAYSNPMHPQHANQVARVKQLAEQKARLTNPRRGY